MGGSKFAARLQRYAQEGEGNCEKGKLEMHQQTLLIFCKAEVPTPSPTETGLKWKGGNTLYDLDLYLCL